jgi:hypothetical protein
MREHFYQYVGAPCLVILLADVELTLKICCGLLGAISFGIDIYKKTKK